MTLKMDDEILHYGKKGMKWGVRNSVKNATSGARNYVKENVNSRKRELQWIKDYPKMKKMDPKILKQKQERLRLENQLRIYRKHDPYSVFGERRKKYRQRDKMSDDELRNTVNKYKKQDAYKNAMMGNYFNGAQDIQRAYSRYNTGKQLVRNGQKLYKARKMAKMYKDIRSRTTI